MADEDKKEETTEEEVVEETKEENEEEASKEEAKEEAKEEPKEEPEEDFEVPKEFKKLVEDIEKLSVVELAELVNVLEKKFGVSAAAPVAAAGASAGGAEEKDEYDIILSSGGDQKINVIKIVREITGLGLKESKDMVDGAPQTVKEGVKKEEAEEFKAKLEEAGATVELK